MPDNTAGFEIFPRKPDTRQAAEPRTGLISQTNIMNANRPTDEETMRMAHQIIARFPKANALQLGLASAAVIAIITEEVGRGDFAITIGRTLIEVGESANSKSSN